MADTATIQVDLKLFDHIKAQHQRVVAATDAYDDAKAEAKQRKDALEQAQTTLNTLVGRLASPGNDLPLFANQSDAIAAAEADPVASTIVARLLAVGYDVNLLIVHGYTEAERAQATDYLDRLEAYQAWHNTATELREGAEPTEPTAPAFLAPQPMQPFEIATMANTIADVVGLELSVDVVGAWSRRQYVEARHWIEQTAEAQSKLGEAATINDLPPAPQWMVPMIEAAAQRAVETGEAEIGEVIDDTPPADGVELEPADAQPETDATAERVGRKRGHRRKVRATRPPIVKGKKPTGPRGAGSETVN